MTEFWIWFSTGLHHIIDISGYDHILFVALLVVISCFNKWSKLFLLVSAFTIGHSISLALSVTGVLIVNQHLIEFLIAFSIFITALYHLITLKKAENKNPAFLLAIIIFFGLIHGLGFSFLLKSLLDKQQSIFLPLLYFNLGIEIGQLIIVVLVLVFSLLLAFVFKCPYKLYKFIIVCLIGIISLKMTAERFLELF
jgi:hypothetical protein